MNVTVSVCPCASTATLTLTIFSSRWTSAPGAPPTATEPPASASRSESKFDSSTETPNAAAVDAPVCVTVTVKSTGWLALTRLTEAASVTVSSGSTMVTCAWSLICVAACAKSNR